ncbi:MAG: hypothetical protein ABSB56_04395 [Nitrososphaerales archaeon]|jgi:hypothetical protein
MTARTPSLKLKRKYEVDESYWLVRRSRSFPRRVLFTLRRTALALKWRRVPKVWELFFIDRMRELEKIGLTLDEILQSTLPQVFGEDTSDVLRTWVGGKARCDPDCFVRSVSKMFGASAQSVLVGVDKLVDEASLLEKKVPKVAPYQSLLDALQRIDAGMTVAHPSSPERKP